jgi:hypothetical protein
LLSWRERQGAWPTCSTCSQTWCCATTNPLPSGTLCGCAVVSCVAEVVRVVSGCLPSAEGRVVLLPQRQGGPSWPLVTTECVSERTGLGAGAGDATGCSGCTTGRLWLVAAAALKLEPGGRGTGHCTDRLCSGWGWFDCRHRLVWLQLAPPRPCLPGALAACGQTRMTELSCEQHGAWCCCRPGTGACSQRHGGIQY